MSGWDSIRLQESESGKGERPKRRFVTEIRLRNPLRMEPLLAMQSGNLELLGMNAPVRERIKRMLPFYNFWCDQCTRTQVDYHAALGSLLYHIDADESDHRIITAAYEMNITDAMENVDTHRKLIKLPDLKKVIMDSKTIMTIKRRFSIALVVEDFSTYCISLIESNETVSPVYAKASNDDMTLEWKLDSMFSLIVFGNIPIIIWEDKYSLLYSDEIRLLFEMVYSRFSLTAANSYGVLVSPSTYPPSEVLTEYLLNGDSLLIRKSNKSFDAIKLNESLCTGIIIQATEDSILVDKDSFLDSMIAECREIDKVYCDTLIELLNRVASNRHWISQFFGLFRVFGHPYVSVISGVKKVREVAQSVKTINQTLIREITAAGIEEFCLNYRSQNNKWPKLIVPPYQDSEIFSAIREDRFVNRNSLSYSQLDWCKVTAGKTFNPAEHLDEMDLIEDKACSATKSQIIESLKKTGDLPPAMERKTLLKYLQTPKTDIFARLNEINLVGLNDDDLIIGVTPKERELKTAPRLFSLMTFAFREYITATEKLLSDTILPYYPDITMTYSLTRLREKMLGIGAGMNRESVIEIPVVFNLDFEKWNLNFRHDLTQPLFKFFDNLLGYSNLISRTHALFTKSTYYIADRYSVLTPDLLEHPDNRIVWKNHLGGLEGLRQKGWTLITSSILRYISSKLGIRLEVMGQGDNQALVAYFPVARLSRSGAIPDSITATQKAMLDNLQDTLMDTFAALGLPIKKEETWISSTLFAYGKVLLCRGVQLAMSLKRTTRLFFENNEFIPTMFNAIATVASSCESIAEYDLCADVAFFLQQLEIYRTLITYFKCHPLTGKPFLDPPHEKYDRYFDLDALMKHIDVAYYTNSSWELMKVVMFSTPSLAGYPICPFYQLVSKGFPDQVSLSVATILRAREFPHLIKLRMRRSLSSMMNITPDPTPNYEALYEDPYSLNILRPKSNTEIVRVATRSFLRTPWVKNLKVKDLLISEQSSNAAIVPVLDTMTPCLPRLCSLIMENSPVGLCRRALSRFEKPDTIQRFARRQRSWTLIDVEEKISKADRKYFLFFLFTLTKDPGLSEKDASTYETVQKLRCESWKRNIEGVTVPPPFSFLTPHTGLDACSKELGEEYVLGKAMTLNSDELFLTIGPYEGYRGSKTKQKTSTHSTYKIDNRTPPIEAAKVLISHKGWLYSDSSFGLGLLIESIVSTLTDVPIEYFVSDVVPIESSTGHRLQDSRVHHHGYPGIISTPFTHLTLTTNTLGKFSKGEQDHPIHFQQLICYCQHLLFERIRPECSTINYSDSPSSIHFHVSNYSELPPLDDTSVNLECPFEISKQLPVFPLSPTLFTMASQVEYSVRPQVKMRQRVFRPSQLTEGEQNRIFSNIAAQEIIRAIIRKIEFARSSSVSKDSLPTVWYCKINSKIVWDNVLRGLIGYCVTRLSNNLYLSSEKDNVPVVFDYIIRFWTIINDRVYTALEELFSLPQCRSKLSEYGYPVSFPRTVPTNSESILQSIKQTILRSLIFKFENHHWENVLPFGFETTGDALGGLALLINVGYVWFYNSCISRLIRCSLETLTPCLRTIRYTLHRITRESQEYIISNLRELIIAAVIRFSKYSQLGTNTKIMEASSTVYHYDTSLEAIRYLAGKVDDASMVLAPLIPSFGRRINKRKSLQMYRIPLTWMNEYAHIHSQLCFIYPPPSPFRQLLRPLRLETGAVYKWYSLLSQLCDLNYKNCAGLGDGSGGVCALMAKMWPDSNIYYNTLFQVSGRLTGELCDFFPQALEHAGVNRDRIFGVRQMLEGISDLTNPSWSTHFAKIIQGPLDIITCDAEGSGWDSPENKGLTIMRSILNLARLRGRKAVIIMKHFLASVDKLNQTLKLVHLSGGKYQVLGSAYSSMGSSEVFIFAYPHTMWGISGDTQVAPHYQGVSCDTVFNVIHYRDIIKESDVIHFKNDQREIVKIFNLNSEMTFLKYAAVDIGIPFHLLANPNPLEILKTLLLLPHQLFGFRHLVRIRNPRDTTFALPRVANELIGYLVVLLSFILSKRNFQYIKFQELGIISAFFGVSDNRWVLIPFVNESLKDALYQESILDKMKSFSVWSLPKDYFSSRESRELFRKLHSVSPFELTIYNDYKGLEVLLNKKPNVINFFDKRDNSSRVQIRFPESATCPRYLEVLQAFSGLLDKLDVDTHY